MSSFDQALHLGKCLKKTLITGASPEKDYQNGKRTGNQVLQWAIKIPRYVYPAEEKLRI